MDSRQGLNPVVGEEIFPTPSSLLETINQRPLPAAFQNWILGSSWSPGGGKDTDSDTRSHLYIC